MSDEKPVSSVRKNLEHRYRDCEHCHGEGLVTIFHEKYDGSPSVRIKRPDDTVRHYAMRAAVPCVCPLGTFIRDSQTQGEATTVRQLSLQDVIEGRIPWTMTDPTLPPIDDGEVPDWQRYRRELAEMKGSAVKHVERPKVADSGNRDELRRQLGVEPKRQREPGEEG